MTKAMDELSQNMSSKMDFMRKTELASMMKSGGCAAVIADEVRTQVQKRRTQENLQLEWEIDRRADKICTSMATRIEGELKREVEIQVVKAT